LAEFEKTHKELVKVETRLLRLASIPPGKPVVSMYVKETSKKITDIMFELRRTVRPIPFFLYKFIEHLHEPVKFFSMFISELHYICYKVSRSKITADPNPCEIHTLDSLVEWIVRDFRELGKHLDIAMEVARVEKNGELFLDSLKSLSSACVQFVGANCLKHASPDNVAPMPLRSYILDLVFATRRVTDKLAELYSGVRKWRVGHVLFYDHPRTTKEFLNLAEYVAYMLHVQIEIGTASIFLKDRIAVLSLKNVVEILIRDISEVGDIVVRPRWVIDVFSDLDTKAKMPILKRILEERGFKTEPMLGGFRVTVRPSDVMEAVKIACMLPSIPYPVIEDAAYTKALYNIRMLESELKKQKPLKRRKISL
jgi:hypothetical protein